MSYYSIPLKSNGDVLSYTIVGEEDSLLRDYSEYKNIYNIQELLRQNTIQPRFRIFVLNQDETVKYQIPNIDINVGGSFSINYQNGQRRTLSFTLNNDDGRYTPSYNNLWANTKIALEIGLGVINKGITIWFKEGVYIINNLSPSFSQSGKTLQVSCGDKFSIFEGVLGALDNTFEIPVNTDIEEVIKEIMMTDNGNGYVFDTKELIYHSSFKGKKTPLTISESSGANYGSLLNQLANVLSAEIFYNSEGNLTLVPTSEVISDYDKPSLYDFYEEEGDLVNENFSLDISSFINKVVVIGANVNGKTYKATALNGDESSPICYQRIGYRMGPIVNDTNITNDILAQERADYELRKQSIAKTQFSTSIFFNPLLSVNCIVTNTSKFFNLDRERFLIQSVSFSLDYSGVMSLTLSNINNLPYNYSSFGG